MSIKGVLNASAILLSAISGLLTFAVFVLHSFYSTAVAQWDTQEGFRREAEERFYIHDARMQKIEIETLEKWKRVESEVHSINKKLDQVLEIKVKNGKK